MAATKRDSNVDWMWKIAMLTGHLQCSQVYLETMTACQSTNEFWSEEAKLTAPSSDENPAQVDAQEASHSAPFQWSMGTVTAVRPTASLNAYNIVIIETVIY